MNEIKILICQDSKDLSEIFVRFFKSANFNPVISLHKSDILLENIKAEQPDIVVMDMFYPLHTDLDILNSISNINIRRPKIIFTTLKYDPRFEEVLQQNGVDLVLEKPFDLNFLADKILELMEIPLKLKEYKTAKRAVSLCSDDQRLYEFVAKMFFPEMFEDKDLKVKK